MRDRALMPDPALLLALFEEDRLGGLDETTGSVLEPKLASIATRPSVISA